jgi:pSer/pThr/pTyr-binding forkhead associated (FHA) protein
LYNDRAVTPSRVNRFAKLLVLKDGKEIESIEIGQQACYTLGRNEDLVDLCIQHPSISRRHAAIVHNKDEEVILLDLDSAQGTFLNDKEIQSQEPHVLKSKLTRYMIARRNTNIEYL